MNLSRKLQRGLLPLYQKTVRRVHDLNYLFFELTHRCNIACLHCGSDCLRDTKTPDLPFDDVIHVLKEIRDNYNQHHITIALSGGEPLCYPRVFELGNAITELEFPWGMVTNGYAWNDKAFELARRARMASVTVSLDGLAEEHDWLRGRKGSFVRAERTIKRFVEDAITRKMDVVTCVNKRNLNSLDLVRNLLIELNVPAWRLFTISPIGRAPQTEELFLEPAQYQSLMRKIIEWRKGGAIDVALSESGYLGPCLEKRVRPEDHFCRAGINVAGIMVDGSIIACPNIDRRFTQGSIHDDSFVEVWEKKYEPFRNRDWMKTGVCVNCAEWKYCQGGSFHLRDAQTKQMSLCHYRGFELERFNG